VKRVTRRYRDATLILETELETEDGVVRLVDFMPIRGHAPDLIRIVEGVRGRVPIEIELVVRYDYGSILPWISRRGDRLHIVAGPDGLVLATPIRLEPRGPALAAEITVEAGARIPFTLTWHASYARMPPSPDPEQSLTDTAQWWQSWAARSNITGPYRNAVIRSLLTLKALTYGPSGGIVAAATTSLPEALGGVRNWDYRYCWLRDATFTLQALLHAGYADEARAWREWLVRAVAGEPGKLQIMYSVAGDRRLDERALDWLPGYADSRPVRIGNAAVAQLQLDVYGELMDALYVARSSGIEPMDDAWAIQRACMEWLEGHWDDVDEGIWEVRGPRQHFTYSKVMVWAAFDRAVKSIQQHQLEGPVDRWVALRDQLHADVCHRGFDPRRSTFTQTYEGKQLDASLLLIPLVGFLPGDDPRVIGTIEAVQRELVIDGFVQRYPTAEHGNIDGLPGREGAFLACSFWLVDALVMAGRLDEARRHFERLLSLRNDVGLLAEEYDPHSRRLIGNFPQAFSHVALVNSARNLSATRGPAHQRAARRG
jgi:GH15 family glucan-1,4-alpha-glucosidase